MYLLIRLTSFVLWLMLLGACTMTNVTPQTTARQPYPLPPPIIAGDIFHLPSGYRVEHETVIDHALRAQVIYVGETHDNPASHRVQEDILRALTENNPEKVALGMEMFTPSQQPILDQWSAGELSEKDFLRGVDWYSTWRIDFALYRNLLLFCRDQGIKILALNAEPATRQLLSSTAIEDLSLEDQARLPDMDFSDPHYRAMLTAFMSGHPLGHGNTSGFERVQTLWDETMAANLADYLSRQDSTHQVMVVAGSNHIQYGFGIPRRLFRRLPVSYLLIGTTETEESKKLNPDRMMSVAAPEHPLLPYHFLYVSDYEQLPPTGVKLGVMVTQETSPQTGVLINQLVPDSAAALHDLRSGDLLLRIDGESLTDRLDLTYALAGKQVGETVTFELLRDDREISIEVEFTAENQQLSDMPQP
ncbi:MAG: ChaN family lipoprotein [Pelovirga sp.]